MYTFVSVPVCVGMVDENQNKWFSYVQPNALGSGWFGTGQNFDLCIHIDRLLTRARLEIRYHDKTNEK
jgi:hypothetical protein